MGQSAGNFLNFMKDLKQIYCEPGEKLPQMIIDKLQKINQERKKHDFPWYVDQLETLFQLSNLPKSITEKTKLVLGGFFIGEGSINVSAKKDKQASFGLVLDPEFSLTQHVNGVLHLLIALCIFQTGRITYKSGSNATLVFTIDNRRSLIEKTLPFCEKYCKPYSSVFWQERLETFKELLELFSANVHLDLNTFGEKMLPLWDKMRKQRNQINASFSSIKDAKIYMNTFVQSKNKIK
jgi:hypothetical protein